jgi:hypothetical protein
MNLCSLLYHEHGLLTLKVQMDDKSFRQIDVLEAITTDETNLQKILFNLIRALNEGDIGRVKTILKVD